MGLNIAVVGTSIAFAESFLSKISDIDVDSKVFSASRQEILMEDGTRYCMANLNSVRGRKFDQLIIYDDGTMQAIYKNRELIDYIMESIRMFSNVPKKYQMLIYQY